MEHEKTVCVSAFSEAAKEIMWVTNEIHDDLDNLIEEALENKGLDISEYVGACVRRIRAKLCNINSINLEKLYGAPHNFLSDKGD